MVSPLEGTLAATIGKAFAGLFYECTVTRSVVTGGDPFDPSGGTTTATGYTCKGMVDTFSAYELANNLAQAGDVKIIILASTLSITPTTADSVTIRSKTYLIIRAEPDPANATWTIQARQ